MINICDLSNGQAFVFIIFCFVFEYFREKDQEPKTSDKLKTPL